MVKWSVGLELILPYLTVLPRIDDHAARSLAAAVSCLDTVLDIHMQIHEPRPQYTDVSVRPREPTV
jgi:hypothetical protein